MMRGLALRVLLIAAAGLLLLVLAGLAFFQAQDRDRAPLMPLPEQALAIARLVEQAPPALLPDLLAALSGPRLHVSIADSAVVPDADMEPMPAATWLGRWRMEGADGRAISFFADRNADDDDSNTARLHPALRDPVALEITLKDGRYLLISARGWLAGRVGALRMAWMLLAATLVIGVGSLWALRRQIRPLERLAADVARLDERLEPLAQPPHAARELRQLVAALNAMQDRIRRLVAARSRMMAAISHDLGSYLTRLRLRAEFIGDPNQRERAVRDIAAMEALMVDALALARLEGEATPLEPVDLASLAAQAVAEQADGAVTLSLGTPGPALVRGRPVALRRVLANLIGNAVKYGGGAELSLHSQPAGQVELRVEDRGPGIPAGERELVLEPFYRQDSARSLDQRGHGLGLAIVADIIRRHGGSIRLEDRPGGGLSVRVWLPGA
jgi:signal transduction histidine kinase